MASQFRNYLLLVSMILVRISNSASTIFNKHLQSRNHLMQPNNHYYVSNSRYRKQRPMTDEERSEFIIFLEYMFLSGPMLILGLALFFRFIYELYKSERQYAMRYSIVRDNFKVCQEVNCREIQSKFDKKLVIVSGNAQTEDTIVDEQFGIRVQNCIKLERKVEMLQWQKIPNQSQNYQNECSLEWNQNFINSADFKQPIENENNKNKWVIQAQSYLAKVFLGQYQLSDTLKQKGFFSQFTNYEENQELSQDKLQLSQDNLQRATNNFKSDIHPFVSLQGDFIFFRQSQYEASGDLRVSFTKVPCGEITIVAQQVGNTFEPFLHDEYYSRSNQDHNLMTSQIDWQFGRIVTKDEAFQSDLVVSYNYSQRIQCFLFQALGLFLFFCGIRSSIPHLFFFCIENALPITLFIIAIPWMSCRKMIGLALLTLAIILFYLINTYRDKKMD